MVPCYVSGKGMFATSLTRAFKTLVILHLEDTGLGCDTRYRYYRSRLPAMPPAALAALVCDPLEYYDPDWPGYLQEYRDRLPEQEIVARFMLERDRRFRSEARAAVVCYDEAGFGSGVNAMRFIAAGKPIIGFYRPAAVRDKNFASVLQLGVEYPNLVTLLAYSSPREIIAELTPRLRGLAE